MVCPLCITTAIVTHTPVILSTSAAGYMAARHVLMKRHKPESNGKQGYYTTSYITFNAVNTSAKNGQATKLSFDDM